MSSLNPASAVPLYAQLADQLLARIRAGDYPTGARIPSEHALAGDFAVGRPTVRQATETLVRRGFLARRRGAGTFVREPAAHVDLFSLGGTLQSFSREGLALETQLLEPATAGVADEAAPPLRGRPCFQLMRRGSVDGEPVLLERFWLDAERFPGFDRLPLEGRSLSGVVLDHYRLEPTAADQEFRVAALEPGPAAQLGLAPGAAVLRVDRTLHFPNAAGAVFAAMDCRTDRFVFSQRIGDSHA